MPTEKIIVELDADTSKLDANLKKSEKGMKKLGDEAEQTAKDINKVSKSGEQLGKKLPPASNKVKNAFKLQKNAAQQLGFQLQDVAVQAQSGTSAFVILGQQGSQLAGVMGPGGALLGAVIAVAAAVGGVLFKSLSNASDEVEDLTEKLTKLIETTVLTKEQTKVLVDAQNEEIKTRKETIKSLQEEIEFQQKGLVLSQALIDNQNTSNSTREAATKRVEEFSTEINKLVAAQQVLNTEIKQNNENIKVFSSNTEGGTRKTQDQKNALEDLIEAVKKQSEVFGLSNTQLLERKLRLNGATEAEIEETLAIFANTQARKDQLDLEKLISGEMDKADQEAESAFERQKEREQQKTETILNRLKSETLALADKLIEEKDLLDRTIEDEFERKEALIALEQEFADKIEAIKTKAAEKIEKEQLKIARKEKKDSDKKESEKRAVENATLDAAFAVNTALFNDNKAIAQGLIVADAAVAITRQFKDFPYPIALGQSIAIAATAAAQLSAVSSASRGGGSVSSSSGSVSTGDTPTQETAPETSTLEVFERGTEPQTVIHEFSVGSGDVLLDAIANALNDGRRRGSL